MKKLVVNMCAEFYQVSAVAKLNDDHQSSVGFNRVRLILEQDKAKRGSEYGYSLINLLLHDHHWQMEYLIESLWWSFQNWSEDSNVSPKMHVWGTPVYLERGLIKVHSRGENDVIVASFLDKLQLEWSLDMAEFVVLAIK